MLFASMVTNEYAFVIKTSSTGADDPAGTQVALDLTMLFAGLTLRTEASFHYNSHILTFLLQQYKDVMEKAAPGSKQLKQCKQDLWSYDLIQVLVLVLKQNFDVIRGQWAMAAELATFSR